MILSSLCAFSLTTCQNYDYKYQASDMSSVGIGIPPPLTEGMY